MIAKAARVLFFSKAPDAVLSCGTKGEGLAVGTELKAIDFIGHSLGCIPNSYFDVRTNSCFDVRTGFNIPDLDEIGGRKCDQAAVMIEADPERTGLVA